MHTFAALLMGLAFSASSGHTQGATDAHDPPAHRNPVQLHADLVREEIALGERYPHLTPADQRRVLELLARMEAHMGSASSVDDLGNQAKVRLFNDQQEVNALLTGAEDDTQLVCSRTRVSGSHRKQNVCITAAQWRERREQDKLKLTRYQHNTTR